MTLRPPNQPRQASEAAQTQRSTLCAAKVLVRLVLRGGVCATEGVCNSLYIRTTAALSHSDGHTSHAQTHLLSTPPSNPLRSARYDTRTRRFVSVPGREAEQLKGALRGS